MDSHTAATDIKPTVRVVLGVGHLALGLGLAIVALVALPARYLPVDFAVGIVATVLMAAGAGLLLRVGPGVLLARIASAVALVVGLCLLTALIWTASYLRGIYGELGRGASSMFLLLSFTILPYLVVYPIIALVLLKPPQRDETPGGAGASIGEGG